jgi:hypothetical protein
LGLFRRRAAALETSIAAEPLLRPNAATATVLDGALNRRWSKASTRHHSISMVPALRVGEPIAGSFAIEPVTVLGNTPDFAMPFRIRYLRDYRWLVNRARCGRGRPGGVISLCGRAPNR